jgi:uncharacterized Zn finger protein
VAPAYFALGAATSKAGRPSTAYRVDRPHPDVLLDLAIAEKRPDDALALYDRHFANDAVRAGGMGYYDNGHAPRLAAFVATSHPERAAALYEALALASASQVGEQFYQQAVEYLKALRPIVAALGQPDRFGALVARIQNEQRRKPKLMDLLGRLYQRPIVQQNQPAQSVPAWRTATR